MESTRKFLGVIAACVISSAAFSADISFTGSLNGPNDIQLFNFAITTDSTVTLATHSYAGGVNAAGLTIERGGFDPILSLFDSSGNLINFNDDGYDEVSGDPAVPADMVTGNFFDSSFTMMLAGGNYTVAISQFPALPYGAESSDRNLLADGFLATGLSGFGNESERDGHWAVDILGADTAHLGDVVTATVVLEQSPEVPVPASVWLFGSSLLGLFSLTSRNNKSVKN